ncbi:MAG: type II toxin-antitoxin system HicB family antitoxin [Deltaproteobacteria bacterium]|nr:type II toxin-antitoxin system HicB family antitoxin [Deltaproteobacteria bacterium]
MTKLTLEYWEDEGWLVGRLVEVPGVFSQGESLKELKENIQDAYNLMLDSEPLNFFPATRNRVVVELTN